MNKNIVYRSDEITKFYQNHRVRWSEFYPSEKWVFERIAGEQARLGDVLDVGCAAGGLGAALSERFHLSSYTGIDIHAGIIEWAKQHRQLDMPSEFYADDIYTIRLEKAFDTVVSLGCADWNIETLGILQACWDRVKPGGTFIVSLRLTTASSVNNIQESYQYINFTGDDPDPERANYVVINYREAIGIMEELTPRPELTGSYAYWGQPSAMARTPFERILFSVFYVRKPVSGSSTGRVELHFPSDVFQGDST